MLKMEVEYDRGILFVRMKGILNRKNSYKINNYLNPVIKKHQIKYLVFNFKELRAIDDDGIYALLNSKYYIKCNKGKLRACINERLKLVNKILRLPVIKKENDAFKIMEMS